MIQITLFCGSCQQQISAVVQTDKGEAVASHLQSALASIHTPQCHEEKNDGRQDEAVADPGASAAEQGPGTGPPPKTH